MQHSSDYSKEEEQDQLSLVQTLLTNYYAYLYGVCDEGYDIAMTLQLNEDTLSTVNEQFKAKGISPEDIHTASQFYAQKYNEEIKLWTTMFEYYNNYINWIYRESL